MWTEEPSASFEGKYYQIRDAYCNSKPIQKPSPPILVGGSGERITLKIVAKYADACNLFGSVETIKRKLDVLKEHCKSVGRDYESILKTKLDLVVIDDLRDTIMLMERAATNIRPYVAEWFDKVLLPAFQELGDEPREYVNDQGLSLCKGEFCRGYCYNLDLMVSVTNNNYQTSYWLVTMFSETIDFH